MSKFTINATSNASAARAGILSLAHGDLATPAVMLMTRYGTPSYLLPDMVASLDDCLSLQLNLTDCISRPGIDTMEKYCEAVQDGSFNSFFNLKSSAVHSPPSPSFPPAQPHRLHFPTGYRYNGEIL
eukprot:TRINITY_DN1063_c0_g2_i9.p2 TRINITY_DN1063_c0_g2~~TRINITY_DN1063_c0_g2_i9.p2  ORF type:complete len:127 (+),score=19.27 TRINITY_DN1063_c0_g2_i9:333-713(+)